MIVPTPEFDPLFAPSGADGLTFRERMVRYLEREFGDLLGADRALLRSPGGLEGLSARRLEPTALRRAA